MPGFEVKMPRTVITHLVTEEVRDLTIIQVPAVWTHLDDDEQIKRRVEQEVQHLFLTQRRMYEVGGKYRDTPHILGVLRDYDVVLVRKGEDLDGVTVQHPDCSECVDSIAALKNAATLGQLSGTFAVVQFTFDQITDGVTTELPLESP